VSDVLGATGLGKVSPALERDALPSPRSTVHPLLSYPSETLSITAWPDEVIDGLGVDPRSAYVEEFWLGVLGPSTTWLLRRLAASFDEHPDGFELPLGDTARALGLGDRGGRHSPFLRSVNRLVLFELARPTGPDALAVRRRLPPLNRRQLTRLDPDRQAAHELWQAERGRIPAEEDQRRRCRHLALSLVELGEEREAAERQLLRWRYPPPVASEAAGWAWERHTSALHAIPGD